MAECYAIQKIMAYAKAVAYQTSMNDPVSKSLATFMLDTLNTTRTIE